MWIAEAEGVGREEYRRSRENAAQGDARGQVDPSTGQANNSREIRSSRLDNGENR